MLGSPYLSSPAACLRAGGEKSQETPSAVQLKPQKPIQYNEDIKSLALPWDN